MIIIYDSVWGKFDRYRSLLNRGKQRLVGRLVSLCALVLGASGASISPSSGRNLLLVAGCLSGHHAHLPHQHRVVNLADLAHGLGAIKQL